AEAAIEICERLDVTLGVARRGTLARGGQRIEARAGRANDLGRPVEPPENQGVRLHLRPFETALLAINSQAQAVLLASRDLRHLQHAPRAALKAEQRRDVVVEAA